MGEFSVSAPVINRTCEPVFLNEGTAECQVRCIIRQKLRLTFRASGEALKLWETRPTQGPKETSDTCRFRIIGKIKSSSICDAYT